MLKELVHNALNEQVNAELSAWYEYMGMSAWCSAHELHGCAKWLRAQAQEEYTHAMKLYQFIIDRHAPVQLKEVAAPRMDYESIVDVFEAALEQEQQNTQRIEGIFEMALNQKAFASFVELQWFITEQVEEEHTARTNLAHAKMVQKDSAAILDLDRELGDRSPVLKAVAAE